MNRLAIITATASVLAIAAPLSAQRANEKRTEIPKEQRPPAGMCRIWLNDVPASQQPAPTDCATAIRHRPPNGRVIFGNLRDTVVQKGQVRPFMGRDRNVDSDTDRTRGRDPRIDSSRKPQPADIDRKRRRTDSVERPRVPEQRPERRAEPRHPIPRTQNHPIRPPRRPVRRDTSVALPPIHRF